MFSKSDQKILWQGFMVRSIFWENNFQLLFQGDFDPSKDCPALIGPFDAFDNVVRQEEDEGTRELGEAFFNSVGLIVVAYNELTESATLVCASTELDDDPWFTCPEVEYQFRGLPVNTHSHAPDEDDNEGQNRDEELHTYIRFNTMPFATGLYNDNGFYSHGKNCTPEFVVWYSEVW